MLAYASPVIHADTVAYTSTGTETDLGSYGLSGIEFTLNMNINVTQLGFTALSLGGGDAPQVTVWQVGSGGALTQHGTRHEYGCLQLCARFIDSIVVVGQYLSRHRTGLLGGDLRLQWSDRGRWRRL